MIFDQWTKSRTHQSKCRQTRRRPDGPYGQITRRNLQCNVRRGRKSSIQNRNIFSYHIRCQRKTRRKYESRNQCLQCLWRSIWKRARQPRKSSRYISLIFTKNAKNRSKKSSTQFLHQTFHLHNQRAYITVSCPRRYLQPCEYHRMDAIQSPPRTKQSPSDEHFQWIYYVLNGRRKLQVMKT